jgi:hypothetical protein
MMLPRATAIWPFRPQAVDNAVPPWATGSGGPHAALVDPMTPVMPWILQYCMHARSRHSRAQLQ